MLTNPCQHYWGDIRDRKYLARVAAQKRKLLHINGEQVTVGSEVSPLKGDVENYLQESLHLNHAVAIAYWLRWQMGAIISIFLHKTISLN